MRVVPAQASSYCHPGGMRLLTCKIGFRTHSLPSIVNAHQMVKRLDRFEVTVLEPPTLYPFKGLSNNNQCRINESVFPKGKSFFSVSLLPLFLCSPSPSSEIEASSWQAIFHCFSGCFSEHPYLIVSTHNFTSLLICFLPLVSTSQKYQFAHLKRYKPPQEPPPHSQISANELKTP